MKNSLIVLSGDPVFDLELREASRLIDLGEPVHTVGCQVFPDQTIFPELATLLCWESEGNSLFDGAKLAEALALAHSNYRFDTILIPATSWGRMLAPRLAMRLGVGLVADVVGLEHVQGELQMIRPAYSGKLMAGIVKKGDGPLMMSIRKNAFSPAGATVSSVPRKVLVHESQTPSRITFLGSRKKPQATDIRHAEVLVSGGGGVLGQFSRLEDLAVALGGQVAASRRLVDDQVAPRKIQVGQSGKTVSPQLYFALGISGSVQHLEGLKKVPHLIAVNTDREAPICSVADVVVVGDAIEFIDRLLKRIEQHEIPGG